MWKTEAGDRSLQGAERKLFMRAVGLLANWLDEYHQTNMELVTGVYLFDGLSLEQKLAMLDNVSNALLNDEVAAPKLTAIREATVGAAFQYLVDLVQLEIDDGVIELRPIIIEAARQARLDESEEPDDAQGLPDVTNTTRDVWEELIEMLSMQVLWDTDWDLPERVLDMQPDQKREWAKEHGIDQDYFEDVALDPKSAELVEVRRRLTSLLQSCGA